MSDGSDRMREILFMAKRTDDGGWVTGYVTRIKHLDEEGKVERYYFNALSESGWVAECVVSAESVCQFTGYEAIRRKKVFEHNIVFCEDNQHFGHVVSKDGAFLIEWERSGDYLRQDIHFWFAERRMYVVGNIFDNPELMKGKEAEYEQ